MPLNAFDAVGIDRNEPIILLKENPLIPQGNSHDRDRIFEERFLTSKEELDRLIATKHLEIQAANEEEKATTLLASYEHVFTTIISSLQMMLGGEILVAGEHLPAGSWESKLKSQFLEKYKFCISQNDYTNVHGFFKAIYEAVFYNCYAPDMSEIAPHLKIENFAKIKAAADLEQCAGGAIGALNAITSSTKNSESIATIIKEGLMRDLSPFCLAGNHIHLQSAIDFITTGQTANDQMASATNDLTIPDLSQITKLLTFKSGNVVIKYLSQYISDILSEIEEETHGFITDHIEIIDGAIHLKDDPSKIPARQYFEKITKDIFDTLEEEYLAQFNNDISSFRQHLLLNKAEFQSHLASSFSDQKFSVVKQILDKKRSATPYRIIRELNEAFVNQAIAMPNKQDRILAIREYLLSKLQDTNPEKISASQNVRLLNILDAIVTCNCYTAKNMSIPCSIREQAITSLNIAINPHEETIAQIEEKIINELERAAIEMSQNFGIPLILLKKPHNGRISFHSEISSTDNTGQKFVTLQSLTRSGASINQLEHFFNVAQLRPQSFQNLSITGLLFHENQRQALDLLEAKIAEARLASPEPIANGILYEEAINQAIVLGDYRFLARYKDAFLVDKISDGNSLSILRTWFGINPQGNPSQNLPLFTLPHLDVIFYSLKTGRMPEEEITKSIAYIMKTSYQRILPGGARTENLLCHILLQKQIGIFLTWIQEKNLSKALTKTLSPLENARILAHGLARQENQMALEKFHEIYDATRGEQRKNLHEIFNLIWHKTKDINPEQAFRCLLKYGEHDLPTQKFIADSYNTGTNGAPLDRQKALQYYTDYLDSAPDDEADEDHRIKETMSDINFENRNFKEAISFLRQITQDIESLIPVIDEEDIDEWTQKKQRIEDKIADIEKTANRKRKEPSYEADEAQAPDSPSATPEGASNGLPASKKQRNA